MASLSDIRSGIATRLATISGLRTYTEMPGSPQVPAAAVIPKDAKYDQDFGGSVLYSFEIWLYVNSADLARAQKAIDEYIAPTGASSVAAAIDGDASLGGVADWARVTGWTQYASLVDVAGGQVLGMPLQIEVMAS